MNVKSIRRRIKRGTMKAIFNPVTMETLLFRRTSSGSWVQWNFRDIRPEKKYTTEQLVKLEESSDNILKTAEEKLAKIKRDEESLTGKIKQFFKKLF